jgi:hypothetical protein
MLFEVDRLGESHAVRMLDMVERTFAEEAGRLIAILSGVGRAAEAEKVRQLALAESSNEVVRAALAGGTG